MQKFQSFEDLLIWQEGIGICEEVYKQLKNCKDFGYRDQIQRSAVSVPSNIAEGYERQTDKEFIQYLYISKGSNAELRTQLYIGKKLGYFNDEDADILIERTKKNSGMIANMIKSRKGLK